MKIVNIKSKEKYDVYAGRGSPFGNPFKIGIDGNREQVIKKFKIYFYDKIKTDMKFKEQVLSLKNKILGCYCSPLDCHCRIIMEYLENTI